MIEFTFWVKVPIHVVCREQKAEPRSKYSDGCNAAIGLEDISIETEEGTQAEGLHDLKNYVMDKYGNEIVDAAYEHI